MGKYLKIGKLVQIQMRLKITSGTLGTDGTNFQVSLPFVSSDQSGISSAFAISRNNMLPGFPELKGGRIGSNTTAMIFFNGNTAISNNTSGVNITGTNLDVAGTYIIK